MRFLRTHWLPLAVMAAGVLLIAIGVGREETELVYRKAVNICMECIGLG